jgi:hypothetical protein
MQDERVSPLESVHYLGWSRKILIWKDLQGYDFTRSAVQTKKPTRAPAGW